MNLCVLGLGRVGLVAGVMMARQGHSVTGVDSDGGMIDLLNVGKPCLSEPGMEVLLDEVLQKGLFKASDRLAEADAYLIMEPALGTGGCDGGTAYVEGAVERLLPLLKKGDWLLIEVPVLVGTCERVEEFIRSRRPELDGEICLVYVAGWFTPGNVLFEWTYHERVIGGRGEAAVWKVREFYASLVRGHLHETDFRMAEMCTFSEHLYCDVQTAFANELSMICDAAGMDIWTLIRLMNRPPHIRVAFPDCGTGSPEELLPGNLYAKSAVRPLAEGMVSRAYRLNREKMEWCAERILAEMRFFEAKNGRKPVVALLGLALYPNDSGDSPAMQIVLNVLNLLRGSHKTSVLIADPLLAEHPLFNLTNYLQAYDLADVVVFLTPHPEFKLLPPDLSKVILDFCGTCARLPSACH